VTAHLHSAARTLEEILGELYPEHEWVVTLKDCGCDEWASPSHRLDAGQPEPLMHAGLSDGEGKTRSGAKESGSRGRASV
jgi:hypothetical protein